jgi:glucan 1,3-beta-glucosidase
VLSTSPILYIPSWDIDPDAPVTQPWIKPSLFDNTGNPAIIDEWTFAQFQNRDVAQSMLVEHWNTWITEADFQAIAGAG